MSYTTSRGMHCKVCEAAKKPPAMVASHFPKNRGITVCPTLLSQQCKGCGNKGHTIKYCFPVVKVQVKPEQGKLEQVKPKKAITRATIDLLYVSSDEEQGDEEQGEEQAEEQAEEEQEQQKAPKESKKPKKKEPRVEPKKKFCWADAESDSSGSEDSDSD